MKKQLGFLCHLLLCLTVAITVFAEDADTEEVEVPDLIKSPSVMGEVVFNHKAHIEEQEIKCEECHHETNARVLEFKHKYYFEDFWVDCKTCHHESQDAKEAQSCSECHRQQPAALADEAFSPKVVVHKSCWECHEIETGPKASEMCKECHTGPKAEF
ncbi:cytochrome c3 family protein [Deltaproteobacteria bacterium TL4]